jgi:signal transduction histidine kinase/ligand-binding sensor domain-containing protein
MQRITGFLAYFFICLNGLSQIATTSGQYPFVHYTPKDGLVNSRVKKAYQDSKGRMYFLTFGGLSVYDGARFRNYTMQDGLPTNIINDILEVGDDSLLVATNAPTLNALVKGKMTWVKTEGDPCPLINQFYRYDQNKIYLSCDYGLFVLENKKIRQLDISFLSKTSSELPYLSNITGTGNYLVLSTHELRARKGLYLYDIKNNRICDALPELTVTLLGKDNSNSVWIAMSNKLFILDTDALAKGKLILASPMGSYQQVKNYSTVNVAFDKAGIWPVYRNKEYRNIEIHRIEENGSLVRMPLPPQTTSSDIKNIIIDRENTVWLCSDGEGVFKIGSSPLRIFQNPLGESIQNQINNAYYSNNVTWYRTSTNNLFRQSQKGLQEFNSNMKESPVVFYEDDNKLLARDARNIYEAYLPGQKSIRFRTVISLPDSDFFPSGVKVDHNGIIIAVQNSGLVVWKNYKRIFRTPIVKYDVIEELAFDKNNFLWVAKRYTGVDVFSLHREDLSNYLQPVYHFTQDQIEGSPRCCVIDRTGLIWIGTRDHGLIGYKQEGDRLNKSFHFDVDNGLTDNFVTTVACDSFNNIIVGTQTGLDRIVHSSESSFLIENLSKSSNFFALISQSWADEKQAYAITNSGIMLEVASMTEKKTNLSPKLLLEEMRVNAKPVSAEKNNFRHEENNISFLVAAPSFIDEKQVAYSYILEGSGNKQWSDTASVNAAINLTNLSAGKYLLRVRAFFPSTSYPPAELSYSFEIRPPWWQTWWFRSVATLLIVGLLIIGSRFYYRRKLEMQKVILEKQQAIEKERTRIATDMHDDLGAGLSRIKFLSQSILNKKIKDEVVTVELEKITSFSDEMSEKMGEIIWALNEKNDTLADLVAYSRSYAVEYLANHHIECEANTPLHLPGTFITGEIRRNIFLSVKESLHNIVKHAQATRVFFSVHLNENMQIIIHDNGKGIDWNNLRAFSNGLQNIEKRMKEINGSVNFSNDKGTKVSLIIPLIL